MSYSTILVFSTVLYLDSMVQFVQQNYPRLVSMVQLSWTFFHETVTVHSIDLSKSEPILLKDTGWFFETDI